MLRDARYTARYNQAETVPDRTLLCVGKFLKQGLRIVAGMRHTSIYVLRKVDPRPVQAVTTRLKAAIGFLWIPSFPALSVAW